MQSDRELAFELQNAIGRLKRAIALKLDHSGLRGAEKHILFLICKLKNGQPVSISEIAAKIGVTLAAVTHQITALENQGLIKRLSAAGDKRVVLIVLNKKGKAQVVKLKREFAKKIHILAEFLGKMDTQNLIHLIEKMEKFPGFNKPFDKLRV